MEKRLLTTVFLLTLALSAVAQVSTVWVPDLGNGTYKNPVLNADYSDPDIERVGEDYYLVASSFNAIPGLPILHSRDLVNWQIIGYALHRQPPFDVFDKPQHGNGVWAPALRFHNGEFYLYYPDPDYGIYLLKARNPAGPWSEPLLVKAGKGLIDPCPLWDTDGKAYLSHAFAGSRAGFKSILLMNQLSPDGTRILDEGILVFDGHAKHPTIEGPKLYKRNGYYYLSAPAGGVPTGWQLILRSKNIYGPYEEKIVLAQGNTAINGPHQGGWVDTPTGEWWFMHFQDKGPYGRVVHLQPMRWVNDWPVMGVDTDGDGKGEPVLTYRKPNVGKTYPKRTLPDSDEFNTLQLGAQWQWHANKQLGWAFLTGQSLRMFSVQLPENFQNFWQLPNLLLQKLPAPAFTATTKMTFIPRFEGEKAGLIIMGLDYAYLGLTYKNGKIHISQSTCRNADRMEKEKESEGITLNEQTVYLRITVAEGAECRFSYSTDGQAFRPVGEVFKAREGKWIGAKMGLFCTRPGKFNDAGTADIDWFRVEP